MKTLILCLFLSFAGSLFASQKGEPVAAQKTSAVQEDPPHERIHDHATDHDKPEGIQRLVRYVGKFHPLVVHFPIALILVAALAEFLFLRTRRQFFTDAARFSIAVGAVAASLGWAAAHFASEVHRRNPSRWSPKVYRIFLFSSAVIVALAGHFGAILIYGKEYYAW